MPTLPNLSGREVAKAFETYPRPVHVITRKRLNDFAKRHPDSTEALERWYRIVKKTDFSDFAKLRETFPSAD